MMESPISLIVGTKSAGRISAFSAGFLPLLPMDSEFGLKWVELCVHHMGDEGIREPILCYEYLGRFYVQEGNKRVSVLKTFGAARISAIVRRILPPPSDAPEIRAYYEFLDFFADTRLYGICYRKPGDYARLAAFAGKHIGKAWSEGERRTLSAYLHYFREAFYATDGKKLAILPEEALLLWLQIHAYQELGELSSAELKKSIVAMWPDLQAVTAGEGVSVRTAPEAEGKGSLVRVWKSLTGDCVDVAFVHQRTPETSPWTKGHDEGRKYLEKALDKHVTVRSYFGADTQQEAEELHDERVVEAHFLAKDGDILRRGLCAQNDHRRIARGELHEREDDERDADKHRDQHQHAFADKLKHGIKPSVKSWKYG